MIRISLALAAFALSSGAEAHNSAVIVQAGSTASISFADLDIHSPAGRDTLKRRIRSAASDLCLENNIDPLEIHLKRLECYQVAIASGNSQLDALTAK
jgi:UrcA family protein